jgi:hypothetical protein
MAKTVQMMNMPVSTRPGMTPAMNRRPIEVSVAMPEGMDVTDSAFRGWRVASSHTSQI